MRLITSSQVYRLMGSKAVKKTYLTELAYELKLGRRLNKDHSARPTTWGNLGERYLFETHLGLEYRLTSKEPIKHPEIEIYSGTPDGTRKDIVYDIKCPFTMKSFCELSEINSIEDFKENKPEYYWQLVSNSILTGLPNAELIVFCPQKSELDAIRSLCEDMEDNYKYFWLSNAYDDELPYLTEKSKYNSINIFTFEVPESDKELLLNEIKEAQKILIL